MMTYKTDDKQKSLTDYKFFCFNGEPFCVQVLPGRYDDHHQNLYDMPWKSLGVRCTYPKGEEQEQPKNFDEMKRVAAQLSSDFPFVRVDLYNTQDKVCFGAMTFYLSSGYGKFLPERFDFYLGEKFTLYR